jgi:hypothetical protein
MRTILKKKVGFLREFQAILTLYVGTLLGGFGVGFSSFAVPAIKLEWEQNANTNISFMGEMEASDEALSWFGKNIYLY